LPAIVNTTRSQNFGDTFTVLVGPVGDEQKFTVHKDLVCAGSKFFMAASSERWTESKEEAVRLPEIKKETFQAYVVWVYAGKVSVSKSIKSHAKLAAGEELREIVYLYLLGDVLDDLQLRNAAMRAIVTGLKDWNVQPSCNLINHIWDSTPPGSLLRNMLVDFILKRCDSSFIKKKRHGSISARPVGYHCPQTSQRVILLEKHVL
jgi:hypothetical protein